MSVKITQKEFERRLPKSVKCIGTYNGRNTKCEFLCTKCNQIWTTSTQLALNGCKFCNIRARAMGRKRFTEKEFDAQLPKSIRRISTYTALHEHCTFKCRICNNQWTTKAVRSRRGCPVCSKVRQTEASRKTPEAFTADLLAAHGSAIVALDKYVRSYTRLRFKHTCGHVWEALPSNILKGRGCPKCKNRMKTAVLGRRSVLVRGYEDKALAYLESKFRPEQIQVHNEKTVPNIPYRFRGSSRMYFPDIYIPHRKMLVEVKSLATLGLCDNWYKKRPSELFYQTKAKAKAVLSEGYKFKLLLMPEKGTVPIRLPKDWIDMKYKEFKASVLHGLA